MILDQVDASGPRLPVVTPCELPDGIRLVYADDRGVRRAVAVEDAGLIDFGRTRPFRKPAAYRGQRNFPGWWWSATTRSHVVYESWLQRHHIIEADRDARIAGIAGQPFELTWPVKKRSVEHVPDLFCQTFDGGRARTKVCYFDVPEWPGRGREGISITCQGAGDFGIVAGNRYLN